MPILIVSSAGAGQVAAKLNARPAAAESHRQARGRAATVLFMSSICFPCSDACKVEPGPDFVDFGVASCVPNRALGVSVLASHGGLVRGDGGAKGMRAKRLHIY